MKESDHREVTLFGWQDIKVWLLYSHKSYELRALTSIYSPWDWSRNEQCSTSSEAVTTLTCFFSPHMYLHVELKPTSKAVPQRWSQKTYSFIYFCLFGVLSDVCVFWSGESFWFTGQMLFTNSLGLVRIYSSQRRGDTPPHTHTISCNIYTVYIMRQTSCISWPLMFIAVETGSLFP